MAWLELKLRIPKDNADALEALLWDAGAVSVTMTDAEDDPLFEPGVGETPLWKELVLTGLFEGETLQDQLELRLHALNNDPKFGSNKLPDLHFSTLEDQNWERTWLDDFKPMRFGHRLWVCPSWWMQLDNPEEADWLPSPDARQAWVDTHQQDLSAMEKPDQVILQLDPGLAFGTGTHPTTSLCLQWLDQYDVSGQQIIDFGCGSGILGIAALLLGAGSVYGIDNDPQALTATADNCIKNQLPAEKFPVYLPEAFVALQKSGLKPADGVLANILAGTLIQLSEQLAALVAPSGWILLSGILCEQSQSVIDAFTPWFQDFEVAEDGDWVRISAIKHE